MMESVWIGLSVPKHHAAFSPRTRIEIALIMAATSTRAMKDRNGYPLPWIVIIAAALLLLCWRGQTSSVAAEGPDSTCNPTIDVLTLTFV
jgi:hypothetical protein